MRKLALHWKIIIGLILGVIWAIFSSSVGWSQFTIDWIGPFGTIFINLLKLIAIPLILFSIIKGVSEIADIRKLGRVGFKTLGLYISTTLIAVSLGLILVNVIKPGEKVDLSLRTDNRIHYELWANENKVKIPDQQNYLSKPEFEEKVNAIRHQEKSETDPNDRLANSEKNTKDFSEQGPLQLLVDIVPSNIFDALSGKGFMLQIIFFAILFGAVLVMIEPLKAEPLIRMFDGFNEVFLKMIDVVMKAAPFFVFALLAGKMSEMAPNDPKKILKIFEGLGIYSLVVLLGLGIMIFLFYPLFLRIFRAKVSYSGFFRAIGKAQTVAFSTSSSAATLPVTMECVNNNLKVPKQISSFVLPIGATVNMDGTSLYISVAVVFLAQFHLVDLSFAQQLQIVSTATIASIGASAVPSAGLIMMILVLQSVGLNPAWIAIIFPVDRILDMCRTVVNVTGDTAVSKVVATMEGEDEITEDQLATE
ncbi:MAG: dicarboxylate/amino acid:cation symporter [Flavobacteriales bacterium]|nr:dicarboxylate/amino acid:cation symporter [Flavobacteriales bacterium]